MNKLIGFSIVIALLLATVAPKQFVLSTVDARPKLATVKIPPVIEPVKQDIAEIKQPPVVNAPVSGNCGSWMTQAGITHPIARELISRENNGCNPCVYNDGSPTGAIDCNYSGDNAYGIPQSMPGNKMASEGADWRTNPVTQLRWMQKYVYGRYTTWEAAKVHHDKFGWY